MEVRREALLLGVFAADLRDGAKVNLLISGGPGR
jgi:hypothetical protein